MSRDANSLWIAQLFQSSVPLRRLDEDVLPTGIASGCLIDYADKRFLLTVAHATGDYKSWSIELSYKKGVGTIYYKLGSMWFLKNLNPSTRKVRDVDFSYVEVPSDLSAYRQELDIHGNILNQVPIHVFKPDFDLIPDKHDKYGFAGSVMPCIELHFGRPYFSSELAIYSDLSYIRQDDDFHVFKLPVKHPGHDHLRGCSGAPVIDRSGEVIALVCSGIEDADEIYAIAIKKYKVPIDILASNI